MNGEDVRIIYASREAGCCKMPGCRNETQRMVGAPLPAARVWWVCENHSARAAVEFLRSRGKGSPWKVAR